MSEEKKIIVIDEKDNVATAIKKINTNTKITKHIVTNSKIDPGFKIAIKNIEQGENIIKYGEIIGKANQKIERGDLIHTHNVEGLRGRGDKLKECDKE